MAMLVGRWLRFKDVDFLYLSRIIYQDEKSLYFTFINRLPSPYVTSYTTKISGFDNLNTVTFLNFLMYRPFSFIIS